MYYQQIKRELLAKIGFWLAKRASRNQNLLDRSCRKLLGVLLKTEFELDEMVIVDQGFDPDELARYEQSESRLP